MRRIHNSFWIMLLSAQAVLFSVASSIGAVGFKITGHLEMWALGNSGFNRTGTNLFEISVQGDQWLESFQLMDGHQYVLSCDGTNIYKLYISTQAEIQRAQNKSNVGTVYEGTYPISSSGLFSSLPWLAYASGSYMQSKLSNDMIVLPAPWMPAWAAPEAHIFKAHYKPIPNGAGLPQELDYVPDAALIEEFKSGVYHTAQHPSEENVQRALIYIVRFEGSKETEASFTVLSTTNCGDCQIPMKFLFEHYLYKNVNNERVKQTQLSEKVVGQLDSLETLNSINPLPQSDIPISISDYRLSTNYQNLPFVGYRTTNSGWITDKSNRLLRQNAVDISTKLSEKSAISGSPRHTLVLLFFLVTLGVPLLSGDVRRALIRQVKGPFRTK